MSESQPDPNTIWEICPACGSERSAGSLRRLEGGRVRCPDCQGSVLLDEQRVRRFIAAVDEEAADHGGNYAGGMRLARMMFEKRLLGVVREETDTSDYLSYDG